MKKKVIYIVVSLAVLILLVVSFIVLKNTIWSGSNSTFSGSRVRNTNPDRFYLSFEAMNTEESETIYLEQGDVLHVSWDIKSGEVEMSIKLDNHKPIYQSNNRNGGDTADFLLSITEPGDYKIMVIGKKAAGELEFLRQQ